MNKEVIDLFQFIAKDNVVCKQGMEWVSDCKELKDVWDLCPRADWMLLNIGRMGYNNNKTLRILIYRILTEIKVKDNKTVFELASPRMQDYIFKLNSFIKGEIPLEEFEKIAAIVWAYENNEREEDINIIVATACSWPKGNGTMRAAKSILGRLNAIADDENRVEAECADLIRSCISYDEIYNCYKNYIRIANL